MYCGPYSAGVLHSVSDHFQNLQNCFTTPNKMTSEDDIKGLVSLKFLRQWPDPSLAGLYRAAPRVFSSNGITREGDFKYQLQEIQFCSDDKYSAFAEEKNNFLLGGGGGANKKGKLAFKKEKFEVWRARGLLVYSTGITISMSGEQRTNPAKLSSGRMPGIATGFG